MCLPFSDLAERNLEEGEHAGFKFQIVHNQMGFRCGYVRVEPGHPWFGKGYDDVNADVHGGLTFAEAGKPCPTHGPEEEWWLGFDCGHFGDAPDPQLATKTNLGRAFSEGTVRSQEYVRAECHSLCEQAAAA